MTKKEYSCLCSREGCCGSPDTFTPEHECIEDVCEDCFVLECTNCGKSCACDL